MKKTFELEALLDFVNWHCLDDRLYVGCKTLYDLKKFDLVWTRDLNEPRWHLREKTDPADPGKFVATKELILELNSKKIDLNDFQLVLANKVLFHVAHLNVIVAKATEIFGEEIVGKATEEVEDFYENLQATLKEILGGESTKVEDLLKTIPKTKPTLKIVKESEADN